MIKKEIVNPGHIEVRNITEHKIEIDIVNSISGEIKQLELTVNDINVLHQLINEIGWVGDYQDTDSSGESSIDVFFDRIISLWNKKDD